MPPNPKRPARQEFEDEQILDADDPRPQRVAQYPSSTATGTRRSVKKVEDVIPTALYDTPADQEMQAQYGMSEDFKPAFLYVERGPGQGQLLEVKQGTVVVGRASVSDLRLQHPSISRRHAQVKRVREQFYIKDLGSQNGTFVNKERIKGEVELKPGDSIALGNALVRLRGPLAKDERPEPKKTPVDQARLERAKRIPTAVVSRPSGPASPVTSNALKIAVFAGAVGFGLAAALAFALIRAMSGPTPPATTPTAVAATTDRTEKNKLIDEALKRRMAERREEPTAEADVEADTPAVVVKDRSPTVRAAPASVGPVVVAPRAAPAAVARNKAVTVDPAEEEAEAPAPAAGGKGRAQVLAAYEKGNAEASLEAAKRSGDKELTQKLSNFIQAFDAANDAMATNNGTSAILNFQKALALDEQLSSGWGKYGAQIRKNLANLYVLVGLQHSSNGDEDSAKRAFQAALKHDPSNERARAQLEKMGAAPARTSADDAFDDGSVEQAPDPTPTPAPARKAPAKKKAAGGGSIDDAFGD